MESNIVTLESYTVEISMSVVYLLTRSKLGKTWLDVIEVLFFLCNVPVMPVQSREYYCYNYYEFVSRTTCKDNVLPS